MLTPLRMIVVASGILMTDQDSTEHPFAKLSPDFILSAIEDNGLRCDGRILELNSYENRVFQIGIEDQQPVIGKFYRPRRWSDDQILEEHAFTSELFTAELSVVPPDYNEEGKSLLSFEGFRFALFARKGGRAPELDRDENLEVMGRVLGRIHNIGASKIFSHRPTLSLQSFGFDSVDYLLENWIPTELIEAYQSLSRDLLSILEDRIAAIPDLKQVRVHGDCHIGNVLWRDNVAHFIDFDDCRSAPAVQDIWMLLSGSREEQRHQLMCILDGYDEFMDFDRRELALIEVLRTLRMFHFTAWLARRWDDPAFPRGFPWFNTARYWEEHVLHLREQLAALQEPAIELFP